MFRKGCREQGVYCRGNIYATVGKRAMFLLFQVFSSPMLGHRPFLSPLLLTSSVPAAPDRKKLNLEQQQPKRQGQKKSVKGGNFIFFLRKKLFLSPFLCLFCSFSREEEGEDLAKNFFYSHFLVGKSAAKASAASLNIFFA